MATGPDLRGQWYRQPVVWLAIVLFAAIVAGCISTIVLGARLVDEPLPNVGEQVFKVPVSRPPPAEKN